MALSSGEFDLDYLAKELNHRKSLSDELLKRGEELYKEYLAKVEEYIENNYEMVTTLNIDGKNLKVAITKGVDGLYISDVLDQIQKRDIGIDVALNVNYSKEANKYFYGVRSRKGLGGPIWEKFGGGGHANGQTGGFQLDYDLFS
jgi:nanoRNase/pAp phosphatase (c-di-AMP/oligoRNAs hydrolase)